MARSRRGAGGRVGLVFLLLGVLIAALLIVGDRVAANVVERRAAAQLQTELGTPTPPTVDIRGFPFLTQAARNSFPSVHLTADDAQPSDPGVTGIRHLDLQLGSVTPTDRYRTVHAGSVDGTALLDYSSVQRLTNYPVAYAPEGRLEVKVATELMSVPVTATVVGRPEVGVADQTLTLTDPQLSVAGVDVPDTTSQALLGSLLKPVPLTGIPYGLTVTGVTATPDGLQAGLSGRDVSFTR